MKLQYKMSLCFAGVAAILFLLMANSIRTETLYNTIEQEKEKSKDAILQAENAVSANFQMLIRNTWRILLDPQVAGAIRALQNEEVTQYAQYYQEVAERLGDYVFQMEMLDSAYLMSEEFSYGSPDSVVASNPYGIRDAEFSQQNAISFLPTGYTPQTQSAGVFPIVMSVASTSGSTGQSIIYDSGTDPKVDLWVFVKEKYISDLLETHEIGVSDRFYMMDKSGQVFVDTGEVSAEGYYPEQLDSFIKNSPECYNFPLQTTQDTFFVSKKEMSTPGIYLVHVFTKSAVVQQCAKQDGILAVIWIGGVFGFSFLALIIAHLLTKPFDTLREVIGQINQGSYHDPVEFPHRDEVGLLGSQINQMYTTIQMQMEQIKQEESQKAKAEIQLYSEQTNPHFLYNTLECIHFQILNQNTATAAKMIESLGKYLRITLSHGNTLILLEKEIEHVTEYMNIINRHAEDVKIRFSCDCPEQLKKISVLKLILQPLVENAIKHGFPKQLNSYLLPPEITVTIEQQGEYLVYTVADNGKGIDLHRANECVQNPAYENGTHLGLRNIYQRIQATYGEKANIRFESTPYYRNAVIVELPYFP